MKTTLFVLLVFTVSFVLYSVSVSQKLKTAAHFALAGESKVAKQKSTSPTVAGDQGVVALHGVQQETQIAADDVTRLLDQSLSRQELERDYKALPRDELERALSASKKQVEQQNLFQKVNSGHAERAELVALATEIRKQEVVARLLLERDLRKMKKRYL
jgi:uncharacterized protein (DUF433 family)